MERIVERKDLYADSDDSYNPSSPDPDVLEKLRSHQLYLAAPELTPSQPALPTTNQDGDGRDEDELEFNLFAPLPPSTTTTNPTTCDPKGVVTTKIRLRSPSLDLKDGGFLQPLRNQNYYFTSPPSDPRHFTSTAVSGAQIRALAGLRWTGCALPWRVLHVPAAAAPPSPSSTRRRGAVAGVRGVEQEEQRGMAGLFGNIVDGPMDLRTRTRRGKKARIRLRENKKRDAAKAEAKRKVEEEKEVAEREKRTKRNREKKIKKRARERAKKASGLDGGGDGDGGDGGGEESGDSA